MRMQVLRAFEELLDRIEERARRTKPLAPHEMHAAFLGTIDQHRQDFLEAGFNFFKAIYQENHPEETE